MTNTATQGSQAVLKAEQLLRAAQRASQLSFDAQGMDGADRYEAAFRAGVQLVRAEKLAGEVVDHLTEAVMSVEPAPLECLCHRESGSHELCCGHDGGRNPDCPLHGDGSKEVK